MKKALSALVPGLLCLACCFGASAQEVNNENSPNLERQTNEVVEKKLPLKDAEADKSEQDSLVVLEGLERHLQSMELFVMIALSVAGFLITAGGGLIAFVQYRWEREHRHDWDAWKNSFVDGQNEVREERDRSMVLFKDSTRDSLENWKNEVTRQVVKECTNAAVSDSRRLFDELSEELRLAVMEQTRVFSQEVLMQTPPARGMLYSRFSRLSRDLAAILQAPQADRSLQEILWQGVQDWHTLGQLYSVEKDQLKQGLGTVREHPIPEARDWLKTLRNRHRDDSEIVAFVMEALGTLESFDQN